MFKEIILKYLWLLALFQDTPTHKRLVEGINETKMEESYWLLKLGYGYIRLHHARLSNVWVRFFHYKQKKNLNTCSKLSIKLALSSFHSFLSHPHDTLCSRCTKTHGYLKRKIHSQFINSYFTKMLTNIYFGILKITKSQNI